MKRTNIRKHRFNNYIKKSAIFVALIIIWTRHYDVIAQTAEYAPENVSLITVDSVKTSYDGFYTTGTQTTSALEVLRERKNIDTSVVNGSISFEETVFRIHFQYGFFEMVNLGITVPHSTNQRKSDLNWNDTEQIAFVDNLGDAESSGMGDFEIWALWRLFYTDETDFQLGVTLINDNAPYNSENTAEMPLGSGSREMSLFLHWFVFSIHSSLQLLIELEQVFTEDAKLKLSDGQELTKVRSNNFMANFDVSAHSDQLGYGGGLRMQSIGNQKLDGVSQQDGYLSYAVRGFLSFGNRYLLEKMVINHPWEARIGLEKVVLGSNAPAAQIASLQFLTFF
ncbi:MAG: hypothetical protein HQ517_03235 [SAR324 cluster bacterium]|nr:hypothetical protein [SAR324 cluster bacterium]